MLKSWVLVAALLGSQGAWAVPFGPVDFGVKSDDGSMILPDCGKLYFSKTTSVNGCGQGGLFDVFTLPEGKRITVYSSILPNWDWNNHEDIIQSTYATTKGKLLLVSNHGLYIAKNEASSRPLQREVKVQEFDVQRVRPSGVFEESEIIRLPATYCLQAFYTTETDVALVCGDDAGVSLFEISPSRNSSFVKTQLFSASKAGVEKGYQVVPNFKLDLSQKRLVNSMPSEELDDGMRSAPRGYIDLEKKVFVFE